MGQRKLSQALETWDGGGSCQRLPKCAPGETCFRSHAKEEKRNIFPSFSEIASSESLYGVL